MKYLSFIALFFYFASLCTAVPYSATENWLALQNKTKVITLVQLSSEPLIIKQAAFSADPDNSAVLAYQFEFTSVATEFYSFVVRFAYATTVRCFSARAPPVFLS